MSEDSIKDVTLQCTTTSSLEEMKDTIFNEIYKVEDISERQAAIIIRDLTLQYSFQVGYTKNLVTNIVTHLRDVFLAVAILYTLIGSIFLKDSIGFIVLIPVFAIIPALSIIVQNRMEKEMKKLDIKAKFEIVTGTARLVEGYDTMSERLQDELTDRLLEYAGLRRAE